MMQTADMREGDDCSQLRLLDRSWYWALFAQRKMHSRPVIVRKVGAKKASSLLARQRNQIVKLDTNREVSLLKT